jgi:hypothetical protein
MKSNILGCLLLQTCFALVLADGNSNVPDWLKYPIFFVGAGVLASLAWFVLCCSCLPGGCIFKSTLVFVILAGIGVWAYFLFGPWWSSISNA